MFFKEKSPDSVSLRNFFTPPAFRDEDKTNTARFIFVICKGLIVFSLGFTLLAFAFEKELLPRAVIMVVSISFVCLGILLLARRRYLRLAGTLLTGTIWLISTGGALSGGGIQAPIFSGYFIVIVVGGLLLRQQGGIVSSLLCIISVIAMAYAGSHGLLPEPSIRYTEMERATIYGFFFLIAMIIQSAASQAASEALTRARNSEKKQRSLLENLPAIAYINGLGKDSPTEYVGPQVSKLLGYSHKDFLRDKYLWIKILHPDDREKVLSENERTSESGEPFKMDYRLIAKDGSSVWVRDEAILIRDENDQPGFWLGTWSDITLEKEMEEEQANLMASLTRRTMQMQTAAEVSRATASILDIDLLLPQVVERIREHFDLYYVGIFLLDETESWANLSAATGDMGKTMLAEGHRLEVNRTSMIGWCIANKQARIAPDVGADAFRFKNPHLPLTRSEMALPLIVRGGAIGAMTIQSEKPAAFSQDDITALQTMVDQVAISIENARLFTERSSLINELESKNAELERFAYTVSHDLKSPLVTIKGFIGYLREDAHAGDLTRLDKDMARISNAVNIMQNLLNDLLELSRIGRLVNAAEDISFTEIAREAIELTDGALKERGVEVELQAELPTVHGDRARLVEAVQNLIDNSVKFMGDQQKPRIEIGMDRYDQNNNPMFFVKDNGMGIEPQYHERIFGLFNRLNPNIEGTGIGLALVKRIIETHKGRIWVESEGEGKGAAFFFSLPVALTEQDQ